MAINSISSISLMSQLERINSAKKTNGTETSDFFTLINQQQPETEKQSFADMLIQAVNSVTETNNASKLDATNLSLNQIEDNLHNLEINAVRAELALSTLISVRNKALEAYSEIMRITI